MDIDKLAERLLARGALDQNRVPTPRGGEAILVPNGYQVHEFPPLAPKLPHISQRVTMYDQASFIEYVAKFKDDSTVILAATRACGAPGASFMAIFDYHTKDVPAHRAHSATFMPRYSENWSRWYAAQRSSLAQRDFAEFIEENRLDIRAPAAATLLDIVRQFKASKKVDFDSVTYQPDGTTVIAYSDRVEAAGKGVPVPDMLTLGIPVFFKGPPYEVPVFMRFKVDEGKVTFGLKIDRADYIEQAAFDVMVEDVEAKTGLRVLMGSAS